MLQPALAEQLSWGLTALVKEGLLYMAWEEKLAKIFLTNKPNCKFASGWRHS